jgi:hypothetical protein
MNFERMLTELWCEKFVWFGPSPIEPFNQVPGALATKVPCQLLQFQAPWQGSSTNSRRLDASKFCKFKIQNSAKVLMIRILKRFRRLWARKIDEPSHVSIGYYLDYLHRKMRSRDLQGFIRLLIPALTCIYYQCITHPHRKRMTNCY